MNFKTESLKTKKAQKIPCFVHVCQRSPTQDVPGVLYETHQTYSIYTHNSLWGCFLGLN